MQADLRERTCAALIIFSLWRAACPGSVERVSSGNLPPRGEVTQSVLYHQMRNSVCPIAQLFLSRRVDAAGPLSRSQVYETKGSPVDSVPRSREA